ncbi:sulfatase-like hydrolase/transferase [Phytoactinopolyspora halotolerans]|uniref:Sulfatase-like hydrolase/transferase n=1 Tax=Phytoactinopolyspora halotolerans TaxID=1981512 RepID=A0A6L9S6C9_9ACTN|nr:sulfatase-like hydrolase/transferase [Phytoactinopolyspora halotolerans]NEE01015.1 sulfatase-like hydrolase/transferase [Phytoactinopolyspora halotolerans]
MRPNVVIIYADDLGFGDVGCFGADDVATPAIDRLCDSGVRLPQWYSNSPVCSPSRASLLTGRYPAHAGVETILGGTRRTAGLPQQETLASELRRRGYATGIFGKWHLGAAEEYSPTRYGFDESFGFRAGCVDYYSHIYYWGAHNPVHDLWDGDDEVWLNGEYLTTVIGDRAAEFIESNADRPFFCYVPFNAPHYPMHAPAEYVDRYAHLPGGRRLQAAMVAAMDDAIGRIIDTLDRLGLRDNTLVFFSSDNGPSAESRNWLDGEEVSYDGGSTGGLRGTKGSVFEGGIRVPSIVSWPGQLPSGVEYQGVGMMMDVLPTVLDAVDGEPGALDGVDGRSVLEGWQTAASGTENDERSVFWTHDGQWAVRRGRFKRVHHGQEGMTPPYVVDRALFDVIADHAETTDISADHSELADDLDRELERFRRRHTEWTADVGG